MVIEFAFEDVLCDGDGDGDDNPLLNLVLFHLEVV